MSGHARIAPSSLDIIVECAAFMQMAEPYANDPRTPEQVEGDAAHWVALQYGDNPDLIIPVGSMTPQGVPVTLDMQQGAELWRDTVGRYGIAEMVVAVPRVHPTECWGTPDRWRYDGIDQVLRVWDYKFGHLFVEVYENRQLLAYALGIMELLPEFAGAGDAHQWVEFTIVQPRSYHRDGSVRRWKVRASDLRGYANMLAGAAEKALAPSPTATTGAHCEFCPARHECKALQLASYGIVDYSTTMDRVNLPPEALGAELNIVDEAYERLKARRDGLKAQAEGYMRNGKRVPGWFMEGGQARLKWEFDTATVIAMGDAMGVDFRAPVEPITPTQGKNLKKIDGSVIDALSSRPPAKMKVSQESTVEIRKMFGVIST